MKVYNKLVRDKIPQVITDNGQQAKTRILDDTEYMQALIAKLREETAEFEADFSLDELADVQEVVLALLAAIGETRESLEATRAKKADDRGAFTQKIFLESTE